MNQYLNADMSTLNVIEINLKIKYNSFTSSDI